MSMHVKSSAAHLKPQKIVSRSKGWEDANALGVNYGRQTPSVRPISPEVQKPRGGAGKGPRANGTVRLSKPVLHVLTVVPSSHREKVFEQDDLADEFRARAREASRQFRQKNGASLAHRQRIIRMGAYEKKHGHRAWLARQNQLEECREAAQELADYHRREAELDQILEFCCCTLSTAPIWAIPFDGNTTIQTFSVSSPASAMPPPGQDHCWPAYWGEPGHEDPRAVGAQGKVLYVVTKGKICGVFSSGYIPFEESVRARKQIEGVTNSYWCKVKSWEAALEVWNETCDVYHDVACPPRAGLPLTPIARAFGAGFELGMSSATALAPLRPRIETSAGAQSSTLAPMPPASPARIPTLASPPATPTRTRTCAFVPPQSPPTTPPLPARSLTLASPPSTPTRTRTCAFASPQSPSPTRTRIRALAPPPSPLAMMDAADAFSRMGVAERSTEARPMKQWALQGVTKFFPQRIDAIDYIFKNHLDQAVLKGSRNVRKLRAFMKETDYVRQSGDALDSDEE
ncbi:hypothetical protein K438DRAFT_1760816 [Mycena galopus ATCC 62051]|nr:hypothetical protein K438DRAFT_1760816 [Mycena galopus ATCC 62051]